ncbi:MAG TPA: PEP-CTERM sorting domain-containing protein [Tepidisphaeraceae bacterium]|jgi:hypothetical protein
MGAAGVLLGGLVDSADAKPKAPAPPAAVTAPAAASANGKLFSWFQTGTPAPANPAYIAAPFLSNGNAGAVDAYFKSLAPGAVRAVKVLNPVNSSTASMIFNNANYHVSYVFGDLEGGTSSFDAADLAAQVRYVNGNVRQPTQSRNAYIGNFGFSAVNHNLQAPADYARFQNQHSFSGFGLVNYDFADLNMGNAEAYPGSPSFRNNANGDNASAGGKAPNIRSSLFTLPIWRVGQVTSNNQSMGMTAAPNIPWTANFNNWGNIGLDNDRNPANGYRFTPGEPMLAKTVNGKSYPAVSAAQTQDQLLSRRDFATMVTHMRMRGADSLNLLESGLSTSTNAQMEDDAAVGWAGVGSMGQIFSQADHQLLIGDENDNGAYFKGGNFDDAASVIVNGQKKSIEQAGALFSGVYSLDLGKLDILISNMADASQTISLPNKIGNYALQEKDFTVGAGSHLMVEYALMGPGAKRGWQVAAQHVPYTAIANSRNGFGIPEPGTLSLLAIGAILGLNRRTRKEAAKA